MSDVTVADQTRRNLGTGLGIFGQTDQRDTRKPGLEAGSDHLIRHIKYVGNHHAHHTGVAEERDALGIRLGGLIKAAVVATIAVARKQIVNTVGDILIARDKSVIVQTRALREGILHINVQMLGRCQLGSRYHKNIFHRAVRVGGLGFLSQLLRPGFDGDGQPNNQALCPVPKLPPTTFSQSSWK